MNVSTTRLRMAPRFRCSSSALSVQDKVCPVIIRFHGGPEGASYPGFSPYDELFIQAGFVIAKPNVRGSTNLGKAWLHADNRAKRLEVISDIRDAARYVKKAWAKDGVEPKVGIAGGSYGGYSALIGMTLFAGTYDAGMANVGMSNLVTFLENTAPYRRKLRESEYGYPRTIPGPLEALSSTVTHHLYRPTQRPSFVVRSANDPRVPAGESVQIAQLLEAKIPVQMVPSPSSSVQTVSLVWSRATPWRRPAILRLGTLSKQCSVKARACSSRSSNWTSLVSTASRTICTVLMQNCSTFQKTKIQTGGLCKK